MLAAIITIGTELTDGRIIDTNTAFMARDLERRGVRVALALTVPDDDAAISKGLAYALERGVALIAIAGGLGPTEDDITVAAVARTLELDLELNHEAAAMVAAAVGADAAGLKPHQAKQATLPLGARPFIPAGTAPGFMVVHDGTPVICLPGVPWELEAMWHRALSAPETSAVTAQAEAPARRVLRLYESGEPQVGAAVEELLAGDRDRIEVSICARYREVILEVAYPPEAHDRIDALMAAMKTRFGSQVYSDGENIEDIVAAALIERDLTLAVGESCTGGMLGESLTRTSGASLFFMGGVIAYDNEVKKSLLGVRPQTLESVGAVSEAVAQQLALGARDSCGTDYGIGITGIAGPTGGTPEKPVGLVYICVSSAPGDLVRGFNFPGGREDVRRAAVTAALHMLRAKLAVDLPGS